LHADAIHRGAGQIMPAAVKALHAAQLTGQPRLVEPFYRFDVKCVQSVTEKVYSCMIHKKGKILEQDDKPTGVSIKGHIPVLESIGLDSFLKEKTSGQATPQFFFSHWEIIDSDPLKEGKANDLIMQIRKRKGNPLSIPEPSELIDKL
jgi:elongation factor 2